MAAEVFFWKIFLPSRTLTRVDKGEVYMNEYILGKAPTTTIHRAGNAFAQDPDTVYAVGSVYGAHTVSFSEAPIDPIFIPEERDDWRHDNSAFFTPALPILGSAVFYFSVIS